MDLPLADVDLATKAGKYVMYVLAVAGGFLLGNLFSWLVCRLTAKFLLKRTLPVQLERALRVLGGLLVAALVAFLLFRFGSGWGLGGTGSGEGEGSGGIAPNQTEAGKQPKPVVEPKKDSEPVLATGVAVTVLTGPSYPKSFRFEGTTEGLDLEAAKAELRRRKEASTGKLLFMDLLIYKNSTAEGHQIVQAFEEYAQELGLRTARKKLDESLPE